MWSLRRWWRNLWRRAATPAAADTATDRVVRGGAAAIDADPGATPPVPPRRHYTAPPADDDPQREARLGAVLEALRGGPLSREALGARVGAHDWGPGRLDGVVAHGVAAGVLVDGGDAVRARYLD